MGNIIAREEADRIIVANYGDCVVKISPDDLAALGSGDSLLFVIEDEYTLELSLALAPPPKDEDEACDRENDRAWQRAARMEGIVVEKPFGRSISRKSGHPGRGEARLAGIVRKNEAGA